MSGHTSDHECNDELLISSSAGPSEERLRPYTSRRRTRSSGSSKDAGEQTSESRRLRRRTTMTEEAVSELRMSEQTEKEGQNISTVPSEPSRGEGDADTVMRQYLAEDDAITEAARNNGPSLPQSGPIEAVPPTSEEGPSEAMGSSQLPTVAQRQIRMQDIAHLLENGPTRQRLLSSQESAVERPSMLSALLADILGLRQLRHPMATATTQPTSLGQQGNGERDPLADRGRTGGTSVIVQGALVSRVTPNHDANSSSEAERQTESVGDPAEASTSNEQTRPIAHSTEPSATSDAGDIAGEAQVATVEEQASMLVRLLSIAAAATAASLLSNPVPTPGATSQATAASAGNVEHPASVASASTNDENARARSNSGAWATQTFQSLRSRIASIGNRLRRRRATIGVVDQPTGRQTTANAFGGARRLFDAESTNSESLRSTASRAPSDIDSNVHEAPTLASLSNMLRDAITEGLHGRRTSARHPPPLAAPRAAPAEDAAQSRVRSINATLQAVREGHLSPGDEGSFNRFLYDLSGDLNTAVRGLPSNVEASGVPAPPPTLVDDGARDRRARDMHNGQLSFFRVFTFPDARTATSTAESARPSTSTPDLQQSNNHNGSTSAGASTPSLMPCILVGVRTLSGPGAAFDLQQQDSGASLHAQDQDNRTAAEATQDTTSANAGEEQPSVSSGTTSEAGAQANLSRYLLFVSGGHYPPQHPLFHVSGEEASRDLMALMEFLGAITAFNVKPVNTVTQEQIAKSNLRKVNGTRDEIKLLANLHQVMENTSERCLICLEDWLDEDAERRLLDCGHLFHAPCLDQWLVGSSNSCPLCRRQAVGTDTAAAAS